MGSSNKSLGLKSVLDTTKNRAGKGVEMKELPAKKNSQEIRNDN